MISPFFFFFNISDIFLHLIKIAITVGSILFVLAFLIIYFIYKWKLFVKANQKGWKALIPFYSLYVFIVKICDIHWAFFILFILGLTSFYSIIASILIWTMCFYNLAVKCNKHKVLSSLLSILFSGLIIIYYGFSNKVIYDSKIKVSNCGYFNN